MVPFETVLFKSYINLNFIFKNSLAKNSLYRFKISFSPSEVGVHYVSLRHRSLHIPGQLNIININNKNTSS